MLLFSLLLPAIEQANKSDVPAFIPICLSFLAGSLFLIVIDKKIPLMIVEKDNKSLLLLAITLHNIPEGLAVGLMFGLALESRDIVVYSNAMALAIGIGIQNIPEGAAVSLPLKKQGFCNSKAFLYGVLSGIVEPISALIAMFSISFINGLMPWFLAFAAGTMIYVVVKELVPEADMKEHPHLAAFIFIIGFIIMMGLDISL